MFVRTALYIVWVFVEFAIKRENENWKMINENMGFGEVLEIWICTYANEYEYTQLNMKIFQWIWKYSSEYENI